MTRKPIRLVLAVAAIVLAGFAVAAMSRDNTPKRAAFVDMNHGDVKFAKGELKQVLNAVNTKTSQVADDALVAQGRKIFSDPALFEKGETCQTCHAAGAASPKLGTMVHDTAVNSLDPLPVPTPPSDFNGPRDPPALWDLAKTAPYFWDGNVPTLGQAVATPVFGHMAAFVPGGKPGPDGSRECEKVSADGSRSADCLEKAGELTAALVAYIKTLAPPETAFDRGALSKKALDGEKLFQGKGGCIECHGGPDFTDNLEHNTGVPQVDFTSPYRPGTPTLHSNDLGCRNPEPGRTPCAPADPACNVANPPAGCDAPPPADKAFVNTPQMRDLAANAPYMHNGAFKTLKDVVNFYNTQSTLAPLNLTPSEVDELVAYLESL
jgi:cytochrome c peroxidase